MRETPQQDRAKDTVERLLGAAERLAETGGTAAVTTRSIAGEAGVPIGTVYRYFKNREDVLEAITERYRERLDGRLIERLASASFMDWADAIDDIIDEVLDFAREYPAFVSVARVTRQMPNLERRNMQTLGRFVGWIEGSEVLGNLGIDMTDLRAMLTVVVSTVQGVLPHALMGDDDALTAAIVRETKLLVRGYVEYYLQRVFAQMSAE